MDPFTSSYDSESATMTVVLINGFTNDNFESLVKFYQERVGNGVLHWDVNLKNLEIVNSQALGIIVAFNAAVSMRGGSLRLVLRKDTKLADLLRLTKIEKIISCVYV